MLCHAFLLLLFSLKTSAGPIEGPTVSNPTTISPEPVQTSSLVPSTIIDVTTVSGSIYTLTYVPSTLTADTVITQASTTATINAGAVVGVLAGAAAAAAVAYFAPKIVPEAVGEEQGPELPVTITNSHDGPTADIQTVTSDSNNRPTTAPIISINPLVEQGYLAQEYQRLSIDDAATPTSDTKAQCEKDPSKGVLQLTSVQPNIADFCKKNDGGTVSPDKGLLLTYDQVENRMQAVLQVTYSGDRGQGAVYTIQENTCNSAFSEIVKCQPDRSKTITGGGNFTQDTGVFSLEPYTFLGDLKCAPQDAGLGLQRDEAIANAADFCKNLDGQNITQGQQKNRPYLQQVGGLQNTITVAWTTDSVGCGPGDFYDTINEAACNRFLGQTIDGCNTDSPTFKAGGTVTDQCAIYSVTPTSRERLYCVSDYPAADLARTNSFDRADAIDVITKFCAQNLLLDPAVTDDTAGWTQDGTYPKGVARGGGSKAGLSIQVTFPGGCNPQDPPIPPNQAFNTGGPECLRILWHTIIDRCDTNTRLNKRGGSLISSGLNGCVQWQIYSPNPN